MEKESAQIPELLGVPMSSTWPLCTAQGPRLLSVAMQLAAVMLVPPLRPSHDSALSHGVHVVQGDGSRHVALRELTLQTAAQTPRLAKGKALPTAARSLRTSPRSE